MSPQREQPGFRHGLKVRMGRADGPRGVLLHCDSRKPGGGKYWKVRLQSGEWCWPNERGGLVVDGPGDSVHHQCASCELPFIALAGSGEVICDRCSEDQFGAASRVSDPPPARRWNDRRRWYRGHHR